MLLAGDWGILNTGNKCLLVEGGLELLIKKLTYTSSHWLTYLTNLESRSSLTKLSNFAKRSILNALPACSI